MPESTPSNPQPQQRPLIDLAEALRAHPDSAIRKALALYSVLQLPLPGLSENR